MSTMDDIFYNCKKHGNISFENIYKRKGRKPNIFRFICLLCMREQHKKSYENNKEKYIKRNLEYTRKNKEKIKTIRDKSRGKNREKQNEFYRKKYNQECKELSDNYIKMILSRFGSLTYADITEEMIFFKRMALMIKRKICEIKYGNR